MNRKELELFVDGEIEKIGKNFSGRKMANNHKYMINKKYIHMFRCLKDMDYIQSNRWDEFEYIATFDIPMLVLMGSRGKGVYTKLNNGKFEQKYVREFAISIDKMKPKYFLGFDEIRDNKPTSEEYFELLKNAKKIV